MVVNEKTPHIMGTWNELERISIVINNASIMNCRSIRRITCKPEKKLI